MGEVMVIGNKTNFNVKCLGILSVFANKIETNDRVAKQTRLKMKFHCNQMMNWRWIKKFCTCLEFKLCELKNAYEWLTRFVIHLPRFTDNRQRPKILIDNRYVDSPIQTL